MDKFKRYQSGLSVKDLFPIQQNGLCACGCGAVLLGKRTRWASNACEKSAIGQFLVVKGDVQEIRKQLFRRDCGKCAKCGAISGRWDADHILSVSEGGGACDINNFQTLCDKCHKDKTLLLNRMKQKKACRNGKPRITH